MSTSGWSEFVRDTKTFVIGDLVLYKSHEYIVVHDSWFQMEYWSCPSYDSKELKEYVYIKAKSQNWDRLVETKNIKLSKSGIDRRRKTDIQEGLINCYKNLTKNEIASLCKPIVETPYVEHSPTIFDSITWNSIVATRNYKEMINENNKSKLDTVS